MRQPDSWPNPSNLGFVEELYAQFQRDPASVSADWRSYFQGLGAGNGTSSARLGPSFAAAPS